MLKIFENRWVLLLIIALTWGSSFILIKKSLLVFTPYQIGAFRVALSGLILLPIGLPALLKMSKKTVMWVVLTGFFGNFFPMFLFPLAQTQVSSSLAAILDSLVPVFVLVLGLLLFGVKSKRIQVIGAVIGFVGAALIMYFTESSDEDSKLGYALLIVLATACYAVAALLINHKLRHVSSVALSGGVFTIWCIPALTILIFSGFFQTFETTPEHLTGLGYLSILSVMGTAIAIMLYYKLIQNTSAVFASSVTYLLPIIAVAWGLLDGEAFSVFYLAGAILIFLGIYLIQEKAS